MTRALMPWYSLGLGPWFPSVFGRDELDVFKEFENLLEGKGGYRIPPVDLVAGEKAYSAKVEIPGVTKDQIKLTQIEGGLELRVDKKEEKEEKKKDFVRREIRSESYVRVIPVPEDADLGKVTEATYKDGVLEFSIPKNPDAKPKSYTIPIK